MTLPVCACTGVSAWRQGVLIGREGVVHWSNQPCVYLLQDWDLKNVLQFWDLKNVYLLQNQDLKNIIQSIYSVILSGLRIFEILVLDWVHIFWDPSIGSGTHLWDPSIGVGTCFWDPIITREKVIFCLFYYFYVLLQKNQYIGNDKWVLLYKISDFSSTWKYPFKCYSQINCF